MCALSAVGIESGESRVMIDDQCKHLSFSSETEMKTVEWKQKRGGMSWAFMCSRTLRWLLPGVNNSSVDSID